MATILDFPFSEGKIHIKKIPQTQNFESKHLESSLAIPGAFRAVKIDSLELVEARDIDQT